MLKIGLTGSIGTGKSTAAEIFRIKGIPVFDADEEVHKLYKSDGMAVPLIRNLCSEAVENGAINRTILVEKIKNDPTLLDKIQKIIHPLVHEKRNNFIKEHVSKNTPFVIFDIPLLFETNADKELDYVIVITAPPAIQKRRLMLRSNMTEEKLAFFLERQMPNSEKIRRADFVLNNDATIEELKKQITKLLDKINETSKHA